MSINPQPQQDIASMLHAMKGVEKSHAPSAEHVGGGGGIPATGQGIGAIIGGQGLGKGLEASKISFGEFGSIDSIIHIEGAFNSNMFDQIGDGTLVSPGKINAFEGMGQFNGMGEVSLQKVTDIKENFSAGHGLPGPISRGGQEQGG